MTSDANDATTLTPYNVAIPKYCPITTWRPLNLESEKKPRRTNTSSTLVDVNTAAAAPKRLTICSKFDFFSRVGPVAANRASVQKDQLRRGGRAYFWFLQTRKKRMDWKALEIVKPDAGGTLRRTLPR